MTDQSTLQQRFKQEFAQQQQAIEKNKRLIDKHLKNFEVYIQRYLHSIQQTHSQLETKHRTATEACYSQAAIHRYFITVHCTCTMPDSIWHHYN